MLTVLPLLDELLERHAGALGADFAAYRNHCYRLVNFCAAFRPLHDEALGQVSVAAAFHDLGIWTDGTFDYLEPSRRRAEAYLEETARPQWAAPVGAMIVEHHKLRRYAGPEAALAEAFRKADWTDVSLGLLGFGLARAQRRAIRAAFPDAGFHKRLVQLAVRRLRTHPLSPMPMLRW